MEKENKKQTIPNYAHIFDDPTSWQGGRKNKGKMFRKLIQANAKPLIASTLLYILQSSPLWITPLITAAIINLVTAAIFSGGGATPEIWTQLGIFCIIEFVFVAQNIPTTICRRSVTSRMLRRTSAGIKSAVVRKLQSLSITYHKDMQTGRIQSKFLKDTDQVDHLFTIFSESILPSLVSVVISVIISVSRNGVVSLLFLLLIPINVLVSFAFRRRIRQRHKDFRMKTEDMSNRLSTMLSMLLVTKSHGLEQVEINSINSSIERLAGSGEKVDKTIAAFGAAMWACNHGMSTITFILCAILSLLGYLPVGDIILYQTLFTQINGRVSTLIDLMPTMSGGMEALSSVSEIMNTTDVEITVGKAKIPSIRGDIDLRDVWYSYPNTQSPVIRGLNLSVKAGECIAFVGSSGSGKSTIMNMIIGFLPPEKGDLLIDGKPIQDMNLSEYRHHISVVPQNSILFSGTIRDNITYGLSHYSEKDLQRVIEQANLRELIDSLPNGLDTVIGEHGDKLSGGQKQRVTIARALIRNPKILILDEATSALDNISEYHVQKAISASIKGRTTFIVAHRLSTIRNADRIVVMEDGVAVEIGTYDELMEKKGKFYELKRLNDFNQKTAEEALM